MNKPDAHRTDDAAARVAEISGLFWSIRQTLEHLRNALEASDTSATKPVLGKISEIQSAHLKVLAAEEAFHAQQDTIGGRDAVDTDAIRLEIGRQLARIRATLDAGPISDALE